VESTDVKAWLRLLRSFRKLALGALLGIQARSHAEETTANVETGVKTRRFIGKRRRAARRRFEDEMCAKHLSKADRLELERFTRYLRGGMTVAQRSAYEEGR